MFHENKEVKGREVVNKCKMEKDIYRTIRRMCVRTRAAKLEFRMNWTIHCKVVNRIFSSTMSVPPLKIFLVALCPTIALSIWAGVQIWIWRNQRRLDRRLSTEIPPAVLERAEVRRPKKVKKNSDPDITPPPRCALRAHEEVDGSKRQD